MNNSYRSRDQTKDSNHDLQNNLTSLIARNETLERDLYTKTELLKTVEDQHRMFVNKLKSDLHKLDEERNYVVFCKEIEYEDLRSYTRRLFELNDSFKLKIEILQDTQ